MSNISESCLSIVDRLSRGFWRVREKVDVVGLRSSKRVEGSIFLEDKLDTSLDV